MRGESVLEARRVKQREAKKRYMLSKGWKTERARHLYERYGLTTAAYEAVLEKQKHVCAVCQQPFRRDKTMLNACVDHHGSKQVRGILHRKCNIGLGYFLHSSNVLRRAANYIKRNGKCL